MIGPFIILFFNRNFSTIFISLYNVLLSLNKLAPNHYKNYNLAGYILNGRSKNEVGNLNGHF